MRAVKSFPIVLTLLLVALLVRVCRAEETKESPKVLRHAVFFKFKDGTSDAEIRRLSLRSMRCRRRLIRSRAISGVRTSARLG